MSTLIKYRYNKG